MLRWNKNKKGFTLVELVIVIAILGILALYALPKYQGIIKEARSSEARAQLGSVRSAIGIYYAKNHGKYPAQLNGTIFADGNVPEVEATKSDNSVIRNNAVVNLSDNGIVESTELTDAGGWVYDVNSDKTKADVRINAEGVDPVTSKHWYEY